MSKLIPVKRMDRNGKVVTRYVRSEEQGKEAKKLPAPEVAKEAKTGSAPSLWNPSLGKEGNALVLAEALMSPSLMEDDHLVSPSTRELYPTESVVIMLEYMDEDDMKSLCDFVSSASPFEKEIIAHQVDVTLADARRGGPVPSPATKYFTGELHYTAVVAETLREFAPPEGKFHRRWITDMALQASMVHGVIKDAFNGARADVLNADEGEKRTIRGLAAAMGAVANDSPYDLPTKVMELDWFGRNIDALKTYSPVIKAHGQVNKKYVERLMAYPVEDLMAAVEKHGVTDINVLEGLMNDTAAPVANGWL